MNSTRIFFQTSSNTRVKKDKKKKASKVRGEIFTTRHVLFQSFNSMRKPFSKLLIYLGCLEKKREKKFVRIINIIIVSTRKLSKLFSYVRDHKIARRGKKRMEKYTNSSIHTPRRRHSECVVKKEGFAIVPRMKTFRVFLPSRRECVFNISLTCCFQSTWNLSCPAHAHTQFTQNRLSADRICTEKRFVDTNNGRRRTFVCALQSQSQALETHSITTAITD